MFVELYEYEIKPGMKEEWEIFMRERAVPYQTECGMRVVGQYWVDGDDTRFVWMRAFEDAAERDALYAAVYESDHWVQEMRDEVWRLAVKGSGRTTRLIPV